MSEVDASVSRMLETYRDLIRRFVIGDTSGDEFETDYLARFKDDPNQVLARSSTSWTNSLPTSMTTSAIPPSERALVASAAKS
jgi:predicted RNA-binding Zn ribbon-like protein